MTDHSFERSTRLLPDSSRDAPPSRTMTRRRREPQVEALEPGPLRSVIARIHAPDPTLVAVAASRELKYGGALRAEGARLLCTSLTLARHAHAVVQLELANQRLAAGGVAELARCLKVWRELFDEDGRRPGVSHGRRALLPRRD